LICATIDTYMKQESIRINKYLALHGIATRTGADDLIKKGGVSINGVTAVLGDVVKPEDKVEIDETLLRQDYVYILYNKPKGITTHKEKECVSIREALNLPRGVFPIGRLDKDSSGLILLTNDGRVTDKLLHPKYEHEKEYRVTTRQEITHSFLVHMRDGVRLAPRERTKKALIRRTDKHTFEIVIGEGKNRQIRRMCKALGNEVKDLERFRIMHITLAGIEKPGKYRDLAPEEVEKLLLDLNIRV
jgi:23S rRNA pseudouridine2604 synthase